MSYNTKNPKINKKASNSDKNDFPPYQFSENIFDNENQGQTKQDKDLSNLDEFFEKKSDEEHFLQNKTSRSYSSDDLDEKIPLNNICEDENLSEKYGSLNCENCDKIHNNLFDINPRNENIFLNLTTKAQTRKKINSIKKDDNLRKGIMKIPVNIVKPIIEKIINEKLPINLDEIFGFNYRQNKFAFKLKMYEILCFKLENKIILENAKPNKEDEKIFNFLLTRTHEFIYENYINNNRLFQIGEEFIEIEEFKTFNDIIEERRNETKNGKNDIFDLENKIKKYDENDLNEFIKISKEYFKQLKYDLFDERTPKKIKFFVRRIIDKFEEYVNNENKSI